MIRLTTAAVVLAVAAFAAVVSYTHIYDLGQAHGQAGTAGRLLPLSVDGLIVAASLVMLQEARNGRKAPPLARIMLGLGAAATVGANVAYGAAFGLTGAVISAWPAVAFIGTAELLMTSVRRAQPAPGQSAQRAPAPGRVRGTASASGDASGADSLHERAASVFATELAAGHVPSIRAVRSGLRVGQSRAQQVRAQLATLLPD